MEDEMELIEQMVAYHKGQSTADARNRLEKLVEENSRVKKHFEETKLLEENIRLYYWQKDAKAVLMKRPFIRIELLLPLAAITLLIALFSYLTLSKTVLPEVKIDELVLRGTAPASESPISAQETAFEAYLEGKAASEGGNYSLAIENYLKALETKNIRAYFSEAVKWNLCLAYLYNGQEQEAEAYFNELMQLENPKYGIGFWNERKIKARIWRENIF